MTRAEKQDIDTITYLRDMCSYLMEDKDTDLCREEILDDLELVLVEIEDIRENYEGPAPPGGEGAQEVMLEAFSIFGEAVYEITFYLQDGDSSHLTKCMGCLDDASMIIEGLHSAIAQLRLELAEILSKLKKGELKEGEPIPDESEISVFVTDSTTPAMFDAGPAVETVARFVESPDEEDEESEDLYSAPETTIL